MWGEKNNHFGNIPLNTFKETPQGHKNLLAIFEKFLIALVSCAIVWIIALQLVIAIVPAHAKVGGSSITQEPELLFRKAKTTRITTTLVHTKTQ